MTIEIEINKDYGDFKLDFKFKSKSRRIGILGASGCGKSITLKTLAGIIEPDTGKIKIDDNVLFDRIGKINIKPQKRRIGYLFQNYALFPTMNVEQNIAIVIKENKIIKKQKVQALLAKFQLKGLEKRLPCQLSGGQQQRVAIARMMAYEPDVILLDEPFSALDVFLKDQMQQELQEMLEDYQGIVILVSHNRDEIYRFCDELIIMDQGKNICCGKTENIFKQPIYQVAARLTGCKNIVAVDYLDNHTLAIPSWKITLHLKKVVSKEVKYIGIRAHDFIPVKNKTGTNIIPVNIQSVANLPFEKQYFLKVGNQDSELVYWYVQRNDWQILEEMPEYLLIPEEKILFLK